jgi:hypothetical protein
MTQDQKARALTLCNNTAHAPNLSMDKIRAINRAVKQMRDQTSLPTEQVDVMLGALEREIEQVAGIPMSEISTLARTSEWGY